MFSDPDHMAEAVSGIDPANKGVRPLSTARTGFDAMLARATLGDLNVGVGRFAQGISQTAAIGSTHTFMFPTEPGIVRRVSGQLLDARKIMHLRPNEQTVTSSPSGMPWAFGIINVPLGTLADEGRRIFGIDPGVALDDDRMFQVPGGPISRLMGLMRDVMRIARHAPGVLDQAAPARALGGALREALLACLNQGQSRRDRAALKRHRQIVARFEDALRYRPEEMLSLTEICLAVGTAERTLNLACREFLGQGAVQYARGRRLDLVHQRLQTGDPATTQVTQAAMDYGFWELGRFAQAYRYRFGELPSQTLRRRQASPARR